MKSFNINKFLFLVLFMIGLIVVNESCQKENPEDEIDPDEIVLLSFGPSPALRGGELQFIGRNLDQVTSIVLPENVNVSSFNSKTAEKITLTVPEATVDGKVVLKTPQGDITSKALLTISEPITISSISPGEARPGEVITINGTYLNLIQEVIFKDNKSILAENFISQSKDAIEVRVPNDAKTGTLLISNGMEEPIIVESETDFIVTLPIITSMSPNPVKAGKELIIEGTDLDLVKEAYFGGNKRVLDFNSKNATQIKLQVPPSAEDGPVKLVVASLEEILSETPLELLVPTITEINPNPVKPGESITISGGELDLVTMITLGGGTEATITEQGINQIIATVPVETTTDLVTLHTAAKKSVTSNSLLNLVEPTITGLSLTEVKSNDLVTITGTDLDLVVQVTFLPDNKVIPEVISDTELSVKVPPGTQDGPISIATANGTIISSEEALTILPSNIPVVLGYPAIARPGDLITLTGDKMDLQMDVIFPGEIYATQFGLKTTDMLQVYVPTETTKGIGVITFITFEGETTTSPAINFQGVDPVQDESLVFFDFNGSGKDSWWGNVEIVNDENSLDGTSYGKIFGNYNGWTDLFWRNSNDNFPSSTIGSNVNDYVLKFDLNVLEPITGGNLKLRLNSSEGDFWWTYGPAATPAQRPVEVIESSNGWVTITVPISEFRDNYGWGDLQISDLSDVPNEFGMAFDNGESTVNILVDNVRFERL